MGVGGKKIKKQGGKEGDVEDGSEPAKGAKAEEEKDEEYEDEEKTVLQTKLGKMVDKIAIFAFSSAAVATMSMLGRFVITEYIIEGRGFDTKTDPSALLKAVLNGIAIIVVAIPEGLPLAVALALMVSMK